MSDEPSHIWKDVSRHGTPDHECVACGAEQQGWWTTNSNEYSPCPKREEYLLEQRIRQERNERAEYQQLREQLDRFLYLHSKYGGRYDNK